MIKIAKLFKHGNGMRFCDIDLNDINVGDWIWFDWVHYCEDHNCTHPKDFVDSMLLLKDLKPRMIISYQIIGSYDKIIMRFQDIPPYYYAKEFYHFDYMYKLIDFE